MHLTLGLIFKWILYFQDQRPTHEGPLHEQQLLFIVDNLCHFILHEVIHIDGEFVHPEHELSTDQNMQASVSGTMKNFGPALVELLNVNDVCTIRTFMMSVL